jgi:molybdopterin synthase catalytic subunit
MDRFQVAVQTEDFDVGAETTALQQLEAGAIATFIGTVRSSADEPVEALELEHYPGMTERQLGKIVEEAVARWPLAGVRVIHRVGQLQQGARIVFVGVASAHRRDAFEACSFIMDYLKTRAPIWKKQHTAGGASWVEARASDDVAAASWDQ